MSSVITEITDIKNTRGCVLFDAECLFCVRLAERFAPLLHRHGFALTPLQTPWVVNLLGRRRGNTWSEMLLLTTGGTTYGGADALIELTRKIWWARPLYWLSFVPGVKLGLRAAYAWIAHRRLCFGGACRVQEAPTSPGLGVLNWLPALGLPALVVALGQQLPGWVLMWIMALALFVGAKWITVSRLLNSRARISPSRLMAYSLFWPGMNAVAFCTSSYVPCPPIREWSFAMVKSLFGAVLVWLAVPFVAASHPIARGWVGMIGLAFLLHFGTFHLLSLVWRTVGINARPIMHSPVSAPSLTAFWSGRWNSAFSDLMHKHLLVPLAGGVGMRRAVLAVFVVSGLLHELVISLPARGGYGLPTIYFTGQGLGLLLERSRAGRGLGLGRGWKGRLFALVVAAGPAFWLFHPLFIRNVILPMLHAIGAT
jgi:predicted DCC family thiol-disulfide oxidoreductase YuxK